MYVEAVNGRTREGNETASAPHADTIKMDITADGNIVIAICTPLMRRVHRTIKHSGELAFIDSTGNVDRLGSRVFLIMTHSCVGGLPLGVLITTNETTSTIKAGLNLFSMLVGEEGFFGRGEKGPLVFISDDQKSERAALHEAFPEAELVLCSFHVLQAFWRFVWDQKIPSATRPKTTCLFPGERHFICR